MRLENEILLVNTEVFGAEITSIKLKKDGHEYIWQDNNRGIWRRYTPVLFPIINPLKDNKYLFDKKEYNLEPHGFARDMEFEITEVTENKIIYTLVHNEETLKKYPWEFKLDIIYTLEGNSVITEYNVYNSNDREMYFSIGGHPAFIYPFEENETKEDYYIEFNEKETISKAIIENALICKGAKQILNNENILRVDKSLYDEFTIIFENMKSNKVSLKSTKNDRFVTLDYSGFPFLAIWGKGYDIDMLCLEPWYGINDDIDTTHDLRKKRGILKLGANEVFKCKYVITIG